MSSVWLSSWQITRNNGIISQLAWNDNKYNKPSKTERKTPNTKNAGRVKQRMPTNAGLRQWRKFPHFPILCLVCLVFSGSTHIKQTGSYQEKKGHMEVKWLKRIWVKEKRRYTLDGSSSFFLYCTRKCYAMCVYSLQNGAWCMAPLPRPALTYGRQHLQIGAKAIFSWSTR